MCLTNLILKFCHQNPMLQNHLRPATKCQPAALLVLRWPRPLLVPKGYGGKYPSSPLPKRSESISESRTDQAKAKCILGTQRRVVTALNLFSYWPLQSHRRCCWTGRGEETCAVGHCGMTSPQGTPLLSQPIAKVWFVPHRWAITDTRRSEFLPVHSPSHP